VLLHLDISSTLTGIFISDSIDAENPFVSLFMASYNICQHWGFRFGDYNSELELLQALMCVAREGEFQLTGTKL